MEPDKKWVTKITKFIPIVIKNGESPLEKTREVHSTEQEVF